MRRVSVLVLVLAACCSSVDARPRHWYTSAKWWAGEAVIVGALVADGRSTCLGMSRGLVERNAIGYGSRSCGGAVAVLAVGGAAYTTLHAFSERLLRDDPSRAWRTVSLVTVPVIACAFHCTAAAQNYAKLPPR